MRKYLMLTMALGALIAVSVAGIATGGNKPVDGRSGQPRTHLQRRLHARQALPKNKLAPITLNVVGKIADQRRHPPAGAEGSRSSKPTRTAPSTSRACPVCKSGQLQSQRHQGTPKRSARTRSSAAARPTSRSQFPEQKPIHVNSKLLVFNGGVKGGTTTLYIHAYLTVAGPGGDRHHGEDQENPQRPLRAQIRRHDPEDRRRQRLGDRRSTSTDQQEGRPHAPNAPTASSRPTPPPIFSDGTKASADVIRTCTGKQVAL